MTFNLIILLSLALLVSASDNQAKFAPFGTSNGDTLLPSNDDDASPAINFTFPFYGNVETQLYVDNNGLITFQAPVYEYSPDGMSTVDFPVIATYWADVDTRGTNGGYVYYRISTDPVLLAYWSSQVPDASFHGTRMFICTWDHVGYYFEHSNTTATFQAILITDGTNSWVFDNYGSLQWTTGDASGGQDGFATSQYPNAAAVVGFSAGDHSRYTQTSLSTTNAVINTTDFVTLVSGSVIQLQTCGNNRTEGSEQCDGGACCTSNCTFVDSAHCFCSRQNLSNGQMEYYCASNGAFYQCLGGTSASQSRKMNCGRGTHCGCAAGVECSCNQQQSPCVADGSTQTC